VATEISWLDLVVEQDPDHYENEVVYEWSNGREFESTDSTDSGVYSGT